MCRRFVILGSGIAGLSAAETIRAELPDAHITLVGEEEDLPYARPLLSKVFLKNLNREALLVHPKKWYEEQKISLRLSCRAERIDREAHRVLLSDGTGLSYDRLLYCLGAAPFIPPYERIWKGVYGVRTLSDIYGIHRYSTVAERAVVIGGGVIGLEMAWELHCMGLAVTVLELAPRLMSRQLDEASCARFTDMIRAKGIEICTGVSIRGLTGGEDENVTGVELADGTVIPADLVVLSAGLRPRLQLAKDAGLSCGRGVIADEYLQTDDPDIYAAGDCVECPVINPALWTFAKASAVAAAHNACGAGERMTFSQAPSDVLVHCMGTQLFSTGSTGDAGCTCEVIEEKE